MKNQIHLIQQNDGRWTFEIFAGTEHALAVHNFPTHVEAEQAARRELALAYECQVFYAGRAIRNPDGTQTFQRLNTNQAMKITAVGVIGWTMGLSGLLGVALAFVFDSSGLFLLAFTSGGIGFALVKPL